MPSNMAVLLRGYAHILATEMNTGQLMTVLRGLYPVDARPLTRVSGQPFRIGAVEAAIETILA